jgi:hypothetical protein
LVISPADAIKRPPLVPRLALLLRCAALTTQCSSVSAVNFARIRRQASRLPKTVAALSPMS